MVRCLATIIQQTDKEAMEEQYSLHTVQINNVLY